MRTHLKRGDFVKIRHAAKAGGPLKALENMDSRFRGKTTG